MDGFEIIKSIKNYELSHQELIDCLNIPQKYVICNTLFMIIHLNLKNDEIVDKLVRLSQCRARKYVYDHLVAVGHLAIGTLAIMNTDYSNEKYQQLSEYLPEEEKERVLEAIEVLLDLSSTRFVKDK